ncbi:MAG: TetR/AcrR family transcriptional regulator [Pseudomonadota bacterium]
MAKEQEEADDTRERLLNAAIEQFAERGFYGASIAQIAGELDLTKQALLYYFRRKEDLYSEVLRRIADRMLNAMRSAAKRDDTPQKQFEDMMLALYEEAKDYRPGTSILMRELLDNQRSLAPEETWYFRPFLNELVAQLDRVEALEAQPFSHKLARVYQLMSSIEYFAASTQVIERMYSADELAQVLEVYPTILTQQIRQVFEQGKA